MGQELSLADGHREGGINIIGEWTVGLEDTENGGGKEITLSVSGLWV